ncbi:MAG: subtilisin family serine protease [Chlamydiales bacterium]|jgi:subtilisin family serine protease
MGSPNFVPGELLIRFNEGTGEQRRQAILAQVDGSVISTLDLVPGLVHARVGVGLEQATRLLASRCEVLSAERNYRLYAASADTPTDTDFWVQWGLHIGSHFIIPAISTDDGVLPSLIFADIDALPAWDTHTGDGEFVVAVLDTGLISFAEPADDHEFEGNLWKEDGAVGRDFVVGDAGVVLDTTGHGTAIAAIIGARAGTDEEDDVVGVNWHCKLMPLRFIGTSVAASDSLSVSGNVALAITALNFAVSRDVTLSNNSYGAFGLEESDLTSYKAAIQAAGEAGHLFVAAAGNGSESLDETPYYPASFNLPNMIVVGSSNERAEKAIHSNYSPTIVDIAAPGVAIYSRHKYGYGRDDGTSYATAFVTGAAALFWSLHPKWGQADVREAILCSALRHGELEPYFAKGRLLNLNNLIAGEFGAKNPDPHPLPGSHHYGRSPEDW